MEIKNFYPGTKLTSNAISKKYSMSEAMLIDLKSKGKGPHYVIENGKVYYIDELFITWYFDAVKSGVLKVTTAEGYISESQLNDEITSQQQKALDNKSKIIGLCILTILLLEKNKPKYMNGDNPNISNLAKLLTNTLNERTNLKNTSIKGIAEFKYSGLSDRSLRFSITEGLEKIDL